MDIDNGIIGDNSINGGYGACGGGACSGLYQLKNECNSFDSGFESILIRDDGDSLFSSSIESSPTASSYFETPKKQYNEIRTPIKQQQQPHIVVVTTPNNSTRKQQIADVDGIYLAFLKSPLKSPINPSNQDNYLRERDTLKANLLRSPAFKHVYSSHSSGLLQPPPEPVKRIIKCKDFITKQQEIPQPIPVPVHVPQPQLQRRTTPTEDEFVELLFKHHLPKNPNCLIGRHMGVDQIDIISELNKRSMNNVIDVIMNKLSASDYQAMFNVSKEWRYVIETDTTRNRNRIKYIKFRRKYIEATKENQIGRLSPSKKSPKHNSPKKRLSNGAMTKLDINMLNNDAHNESMSIYIDKTISFERKLIINGKPKQQTANNWFLLEQNNKTPVGDDGVQNSPNDSFKTNKTTLSKIGSKSSKKNLKRL